MAGGKSKGSSQAFFFRRREEKNRPKVSGSSKPLIFFLGQWLSSDSCAMKSCVTNLQRTVPVNVPLLEENVVRVKRALGISKFKLNVWLRSDKMVQRMNKIDRNIDKPTDVLSYSYQVRLI